MSTPNLTARPFTVMVTGGAGYIGSHAVLALNDAGWPVVVLDNLVTGFQSAVDPRAAFVLGDVGDLELVKKIVSDHSVGAIMHFAGSVVVPESVADPLKYYRNNTSSSVALFEAAVMSGVRHLIFSSTAAVYGIPPHVPAREDMPVEPINPYGRSKLMVEWVLADMALAAPINYCALRYFNVAGADPALRTGQSTVGATHLIKVAVEAALGKRETVSVFGTNFDTPDGTGVRDYIHVSDLAAAHVEALQLLVDQPGASHTLNCGYGGGFSVTEVLNAVERISGAKLQRVIADRRPGDPDCLISDNRRILELTKWQPKLAELDTIIGHALSWELKLSDKG